MRRVGLLLLALVSTAPAGDPKATRLAESAREVHAKGDSLWKRYVLEEDLDDDELEALVESYEKAVDLYQKALEVEERPGLHKVILQLARRIGKARMGQAARARADEPRDPPATEPSKPPVKEPRAPEEPPVEPAEKPEPRPALPSIEETKAERLRGIRRLRGFLMHHYFPSRKFASLVDRCAVCNGSGRRRTGVLDKRRRPVTIPCNHCNESGAHLSVAAARKGFWLCWSPLYRVDEERRSAWETRLEEWRRDPRKVPEFLKRLRILDVQYHGLWAVATWEEQGWNQHSRKRFKRTVERKLLRVGKRWFFYHDAADRDFFTADAE